MQLGGEPIRVQLNQDLTSYNSELTTGALGTTMPDKKFGVFGGMDTFVAVKFDTGLETDIAWKSLDTL